jgi:hypothetical protein
MSPKSPTKRSLKDDDNMRPFKKFIVELTGFDKDPVLDDLTTRTTSTITTSEVDLYQRRRRVAKFVDVDQKRKDMVSPKFLIPIRSMHLNDYLGEQAREGLDGYASNCPEGYE